MTSTEFVVTEADNGGARAKQYPRKAELSVNVEPGKTTSAPAILVDCECWATGYVCCIFYQYEWFSL